MPLLLNDMGKTAVNIKYHLLKGLLTPVSWLPLPVLYCLSDVLAWFAGDVMRYRKKTVIKNLTESFPEASGKDIKRYTRKFYRNFTDQILEMIKLLTISEKNIRKRMKFVNQENAWQYLSAGRQVIAYFSHTGNWEWVTSFGLDYDRQVAEGRMPAAVFGQVYRPLKNKAFDRLMLYLRGRFGAVSYPKSLVARNLLVAARRGQPGITGFMSDQKPSHGDPTYVCMFLNHPTAMITGTEVLARKLDAAVVYLDMKRISRGHYEVDVVDITGHAADTEPGFLTEKYRTLLQDTIRRDPPLWLWSHKRWKYPVKLT